MTTLLVLGGTGPLTSALLEQAQGELEVTRLVVPSEQPLAPAPKLENPIVDYSSLPQDAPWWSADAMLCLVDARQFKTRNKARLQALAHAYPLAAARLARAAGTPACVFNSAAGAARHSPFLHNRLKAQLEADLRACRFPSLTIVRPGIIGAQKRPAEHLPIRPARHPRGVLPHRLRVNPVNQVAASLLEAALLSAPGARIIESHQITA